MLVDLQFLSRLRELAKRVRGADPALEGLAYFLTPTDAEMVAMRRSVLDLLAEAEHSSTELLDELLPQLDGTPIEDLAAIVASEVGGELSSILRVDDDSSTTWEVGIIAVQSLSKILKAVAAIENAYCAELEIPKEISHVAETETAVEIRQAYYKFWRSVALETPETPEEVEKRLRSASTAIAQLRGRPIFLDLRPLDRRLLLRLQRRIREWLLRQSEAESGLHLWQDLRAFTELLHLINNRAELVQLDAQLIPELQSVLAELDGVERPLVDDPDLLRRMRRLTGRSAALDRLLDCPEAAQGRELFEVMGRMEMEMLTGLMPSAETGP
ncbi:MAG: hypothetical protein AAGF23_06365 [Acidobacteriota bacterium]